MIKRLKKKLIIIETKGIFIVNILICMNIFNFFFCGIKVFYIFLVKKVKCKLKL